MKGPTGETSPADLHTELKRRVLPQGDTPRSSLTVPTPFGLGCLGPSLWMEALTGPWILDHWVLVQGPLL